VTGTFSNESAPNKRIGNQCHNPTLIEHNNSGHLFRRGDAMQSKTITILAALCLTLPLGTAFAANAAPDKTPAFTVTPVVPTIVPTNQILSVMPDPLPKTVDNLIVVDRKVGTGVIALKAPGNKTISAIHYSAWVYDPMAADGHGVKFASSRDTNRPYLLLLGEGKVIRGLEAGISGMRVGGQRTLIIPSKMGYGGDIVAGGKVPSNSNLIFDVELLEVK
jgi:FKBP-type peptidyl-prolyl cis-trans isomerase FkpA